MEFAIFGAEEDPPGTIPLTYIKDKNEREIVSENEKPKRKTQTPSIKNKIAITKSLEYATFNLLRVSR